MKKWIHEVLLTTCVSYTLISVATGFINAMGNGEWQFYANLLMMLVWTGVAVSVLYAHTLFEGWPPVLVMAVQYVIAMGLVFLITCITHLFAEPHPTWARDVFRSFTIPYVIGAAAFYMETFSKAKKADHLLQQIKRQKERER